MADTFYIKQGAHTPSLINTLYGEDDAPLVLDGTVVLRLSHPNYGVFNYSASLITPQTGANIGKVQVDGLGLTPDGIGIMVEGKYKAEWRYLTTTNKLTIFPTEVASYDTPITDTIIIQKSL